MLVEALNNSNHCCCSVNKLCPMLCDPMDTAHQASLSFTISQSMVKLMSIESVMPSNHLILCHPLLPLPSIFPGIKIFPMSWLFPSGRQSIGVSASASVLPRTIRIDFFRIDWFDLLAVQGILKGLLHTTVQRSILKHLAFFMVQLSYPYMITGKTIASNDGDFQI